MSPVLDVDVLLLYATALAAKRRPAGFAEIVAAIDLVHRNVPGEEKLIAAFARLGARGLLHDAGGGVALTEAGEALIRILPRKAEHAGRLFELKGLLGAHKPASEAPPLVVDGEQLRASIVAHRVALAAGGQNLLVPKPKPEAAQARPGQRQRKPMPKSRKR